MNYPQADHPGGRSVLLRGGIVHSAAARPATAMLVRGGTIAWIGAEAAAADHAASADEVIDLDGALVTPAFVDAHVHTTATGLTLTGLDLSAARSPADALTLLAAHAAARPADRVLYGHGWDPTNWPEHQTLTRAEIDTAVPGRAVYLTRADMHSAAVSTALLDAVPAISDLPGYRPDGSLTQDAHHAARRVARDSVTPAHRRAAQLAVLHRAAALGIGTLHECAGPDISGEDDVVDLLQLAGSVASPRVYAYWAEALTPGDAKSLERIRDLGVIGAAGDLVVDGSLGSHTAWLAEPYADADHHGVGYLDAERIADHVTACSQAGLQAGFHAIGDAAISAVVAGVRTATRRLGLSRVRSLRHRVEHAEMLTPGNLAAFAELGLAASVQPAFDAAWGGQQGMYAQRLGPSRERAMNPLAALMRYQVVLAFGYDSPVTPLDPWGAVRAAAFHRTPEHRIPVPAAFTAHTRGGWQIRGHRGGGVLAPGAPADYAVWAVDQLTAQPPTIPGALPMPDLTPGRDLPRCLRTVVGGRTISA